MPSKQGFGNSRTPLKRKPQYGMDQKSPPIMQNAGLDEYADTVSNAQENIELSKENPIAKKSTLPGINTEIDKK